MPLYTYRHPDTGEEKDVIQSMNDEHIYIDEFGLEWKRVFTVPHASIDSNIDPFSQSQFRDSTGAKKGTVGNMLDYSEEMSQRRAEKAERASIKFKQAEYMLDKIGQEFYGIISGVSKWGIYVEIEEKQGIVQSEETIFDQKQLKKQKKLHSELFQLPFTANMLKL